jgi:hypothetical protein
MGSMVEMQKLKSFFSFLLQLCLLLSFKYISHACQGTAEMRGTVFDQAGAHIVEAFIELQGSHIYTTRTNSQGQYRISSIVPGRYILKITSEGFAPYSQEVELKLQHMAPLDVTLTIILNDRVEIRNDEAVVSTEPENNLSALTLSEEELKALPDDPDKLLQMLSLMAGSNGGAGSAAIYVDGFPQSGRIPPKSSIQMIRINSNPFSAEFSEPGRARIEITTKPGSDKFQGEFAFNFNSSALNARNAFATSRAPLQIRNYSGYFNGPILPKRWDFLFYAGVWQQDENSIVNAIVLNPNTLLPQSFNSTVVTPTSNKDVSLHSSLLLTKEQTLAFGYSYARSEAENQGLEGGFDLPERSFNSLSRNDALRLSLTSIPNNHLLNQIRFQLRDYKFETESLNSDPAILVFDAFNAGGNQGSLLSQISNKNLQIVDNLSYTYKKHTLKLGVRADVVQLRNVNLANFNGTFTFGTDFERDAVGNPILGDDKVPIVIMPLEHYRRTILGLQGYKPSQFSITLGNPLVKLSQWDMSLYAQDDWRVSNQLTLSYGLRYEFQTNLEDKLNFAPRFGLAWSPEKSRKGVIRFGAGLFYNRIDPGITLETIRLDGKHQKQILIEKPAFFPDIPAQFNSGALLPTLRMKSGGLNAPYLIISTISYERQLPWKMLGSASYTWQRGIHLLRTQNINSPIPGMGIRPFPDLGQVFQFESTGISTRHELRLTLRTKINRRFNLFSNYILASTKTDTEGAYFAPANSNDLSVEFARASSDQRHRLFLGGSVSLPWKLQFSPFLFISSNRPFNITTGRDSNGDTLFTDRPAFAKSDTPGAVVTRFGIFNPLPKPGDQIIPRNFGEGPSQININASFSKTFSFNLPESSFPGNGSKPSGQPVTLTNEEGGSLSGGNGSSVSAKASPVYLTFSVDIENCLNHTNLSGFNGVLKSLLFGRANRALDARRIFLRARFSF